MKTSNIATVPMSNGGFILIDKSICTKDELNKYVEIAIIHYLNNVSATTYKGSRKGGHFLLAGYGLCGWPKQKSQFVNVPSSDKYEAHLDRLVEAGVITRSKTQNESKIELTSQYRIPK